MIHAYKAALLYIIINQWKKAFSFFFFLLAVTSSQGGDGGFSFSFSKQHIEKNNNSKLI